MSAFRLVVQSLFHGPGKECTVVVDVKLFYSGYRYCKIFNCYCCLLFFFQVVKVIRTVTEEENGEYNRYVIETEIVVIWWKFPVSVTCTGKHFQFR